MVVVGVVVVVVAVGGFSQQSANAGYVDPTQLSLPHVSSPAHSSLLSQSPSLIKQGSAFVQHDQTLRQSKNQDFKVNNQSIKIVCIVLQT